MLRAKVSGIAAWPNKKMLQVARRKYGRRVVLTSEETVSARGQ